MIYNFIAKVEKINAIPFKTVPRAYLSSKGIKMELDYNANLLFVSEGDSLQVQMFLSTKPVVDNITYMMEGTIYEIGEGNFNVSFGGLLLKFEGELNEELREGHTLFITVIKV